MKYKQKLMRLFFAAVCLIVFTCICTVSANAAAGTINESEPNDEFNNPDVTYSDYDNFGYISSSSDWDMWKVTFTHSGYANFYLGSIPSGCNYELGIYNSSMTQVVGESFNTGNTRELITMGVNANTTYYIAIFTINGYNTSDSYKLRVKLYPTKSLSIPLYRQLSGDTCSCACARMMLKYYGITITEEDYKAKVISECGRDADFTVIGNKATVYNAYLEEKGISTRYRASYIGSYTSSQYESLLVNNIVNNYPIETLVAITDTNYFPYTTNGHYLVAKGLFYDTTSLEYMSKILDPHNIYAGTYNVPISSLWDYTLSHYAQGFILHVVY